MVTFGMLTGIIKKFLPLFGLAIVLPFMLTLISKPDTLTFLTHAEKDLKLTLWFEPSNVISRVGQNVEVDVLASFESDATPLTYLKLDFSQVANVTFTPTFVVYEAPFRGTVKVGTLNLVAAAAGSYEISIPSSNVVLTTNLEVTTQTGGLNLVIR